MKKRYFLAAILLVLTLLACCSMALADDDVPPPDLISDNPNFSSLEWRLNVMPLDEDVKLTYMSASISKADSTHVFVKGMTQANKICYRIGGYMTIQQWKNNKWNTYTTVSYSEYGTATATGTATISVATGYYYRVIISHYANHGEDNDLASITTKSVLVN